MYIFCPTLFCLFSACYLILSSPLLLFFSISVQAYHSILSTIKLKSWVYKKKKKKLSYGTQSFKGFQVTQPTPAPSIRPLTISGKLCQKS